MLLEDLVLAILEALVLLFLYPWERLYLFLCQVVQHLEVHLCLSLRAFLFPLELRLAPPLRSKIHQYKS